MKVSHIKSTKRRVQRWSVLAALIFKPEHTQLIVLEVGMGGRLETIISD
jgi:folylpolyglutamate synthase/dihydropteroate synthase